MSTFPPVVAPVAAIDPPVSAVFVSRLLPEKIRAARLHVDPEMLVMSNSIRHHALSGIVAVVVDWTVPAEFNRLTVPAVLSRRPARCVADP